MAKKNTLLIVGIIAVVITAAFFIPQLSDYTITYRSCSYISETKLEGATQPGDCFVSGNAATGDVDLHVLNSIFEDSRTGPTGPELFCNYDFCSGTTECRTLAVDSCELAWYNGQLIAKPCNNDDECPSDICVNHVCRITLPATSCTPGERRCASSEKYETCLSNSQWSGLLSCAAGQVCSNGLCITSPTAPTCTSFTYTNYGECEADGYKHRDIIYQGPTGCTGGNPVLVTPCEFVPACTSANWERVLGVCQTSNTRTVTYVKIGTCTGGVTQPAATTEACSYTSPTCTSFEYSAWGACQLSDVQTRVVTSSSPSGCQGGTPVLSQACTYTPGGTGGGEEFDWNKVLFNLGTFEVTILMASLAGGALLLLLLLKK